MRGEGSGEGARPRWSIRARLIFLVGAIAVPMNVLIVATVLQLGSASRAAQYTNLQHTTRAIVSALDAQLLSRLTLAEALAASPALQADDLTAFQLEAERAFPDPRKNWLVVADAQGQQLVNLIRPSGTPLPSRTPAGLAVQKRAFEAKSPVFSGAILGPVAGRWAATVEIPVFRDGKPFRVLAAVMDAENFLDLMARQKLPATWRTGIADADGILLARLPDNVQYVGQPASAGWRAVMDREGIFATTTLDGIRVMTSTARSSLSGWSVGIGVDERELEAPVRTTIMAGSLLGVTVSVLSLLLAFRIARHISHGIAELQEKVHAVVAGQAVTLSTSLAEVTGVLTALQGAVDEKRKAEERLTTERAAADRRHTLLMNELTHRVKNTLAVVQAIAVQTTRTTSDPEAFAQAFAGRLSSLARAHDLLTGSAWAEANLEDIVSAAVEPFAGPSSGAAENPRVAIAGPPVDLPANTTITLTLMLHELGTNAAKYGALSVKPGRVRIGWTVSGLAERVVELVWSEECGPPVREPQHTGFGTRLLHLGALQLGGELAVDYATQGLDVKLRFPVPDIKTD